LHGRFGIGNAPHGCAGQIALAAAVRLVQARGIPHWSVRLHDRDKSAWRLLYSTWVPAVFGRLAKTEWFAGDADKMLHHALALAGLALSIWGFVEIGCLRGTAGSNRYGPIRQHAERPKKQKKPDGHQATGRTKASVELRNSAPQLASSHLLNLYLINVT
jgi:hypothetical protein